MTNEVINILGKILTNILTALYEQFGFFVDNLNLLEISYIVNYNVVWRKLNPILFGMPVLALLKSEINRPQVFIAKRNEPQVWIFPLKNYLLTNQLTGITIFCKV